MAISFLRDQRNNYVGEDFGGFTITKFDEATITVQASPGRSKALPRGKFLTHDSLLAGKIEKRQPYEGGGRQG